MVREIDAGKCIVALGHLFFRPGSRNDLAVKHDIHSLRMLISRIDKAVKKIRPCICHVMAYRFLRPGNDNRLVGILYHVGQCTGSIRQRVRTVADNKSVIAVIILLYSLHNQLPMLRLYVRAVQIAHLDCLHVTDIFHIRNII